MAFCDSVQDRDGIFREIINIIKDPKCCSTTFSGVKRSVTSVPDFLKKRLRSKILKHCDVSTAVSFGNDKPLFHVPIDEKVDRDTFLDSNSGGGGSSKGRARTARGRFTAKEKVESSEEVVYNINVNCTAGLLNKFISMENR